jgi:cytochrome P450
MLEFIPSDEEHGQRRRIYAHAFSDQAIRKQEPGIKKHIHKLVVKLEANARQAPDEPQDLVQWLHFTTFDIMGELAFGENLGMLDDAKYIPWVAAIVGSFKAFIRMHIFSSHQPFGWLFKMTLQPLVKKKIDDHRAFAAERVNKRLAKEIDQPDIWNLVINAKPERLPSRWAMQEDGMLFMQAGTDTSASALSGMFYYLLKNPDKQAKLVKEIRDSFHSLDDITGDKLARLPYLSACLEEGMRLYPPASNAFERFAPPGGMMVCGEFIPEGMKVGIPHFAAYRFADNWSLPDEFHPERWMGKDSRFANDKREVLQPFLYGPRNCLGKNLAYNEMRLIVAYLIVSFDIEHTKESENWFPHEVYALWQKPPMKLKFTPVAKA